jgi:hypothetical protein
MKISKKRLKMVEAAISNAFDQICQEHINQEEIQYSPETWSDDTREKFDMLNEMLCLSKELVEEALTK